jgi:23S rRNA pseudouridine2605 synthase
MIADGRVAVEGTVLTNPAVNVGPESRVTVDGALLGEPAPSRLWRYHKPKGMHRPFDEQLPPELRQAIPIGGLGLHSEGLLLLTNDGDLARTLQDRATGWRRQYRVRIFGNVSHDVLARLGDGIEFDAEPTGPLRVNLDRRSASATWLIINVQSDADHIISRSLGQFGLNATRFIRLTFGPFRLGDLPRGAVEKVNMDHVNFRL